MCADCVFPEGTTFQHTFTIEILPLDCSTTLSDSNRAGIATVYEAYYRTEVDPAWALPGDWRGKNKPFTGSLIMGCDIICTLG